MPPNILDIIDIMLGGAWIPNKFLAIAPDGNEFSRKTTILRKHNEFIIIILHTFQQLYRNGMKSQLWAIGLNELLWIVSPKIKILKRIAQH